MMKPTARTIAFVSSSSRSYQFFGLDFGVSHTNTAEMKRMEECKRTRGSIASVFHRFLFKINDSLVSLKYLRNDRHLCHELGELEGQRE